MRSYSRVKEDGFKETWLDTVSRVVEGSFQLHELHCEQNKIKVNREWQVEKSVKMFEKIYEMKFLPPGRGLWAMGTPLIDKKKNYTALNNCAFVSSNTEDVNKLIESFTFLMDSAMLGVGVGFDTKGAGKFKV